MICFQLQHIKPENIPKPPYNTGTMPTSAPPSLNVTEDPLPRPSSPVVAPTSAQNKGKTPLSKSKSTSAPHPSSNPSSAQTPAHRRLPLPPTPHPPLSNRVSAYSPAISTGMLVETVKAGMNATNEAGAPGAGGAPAGQGPVGGGAAKGKRKVVRVRG